MTYRKPPYPVEVKVGAATIHIDGDFKTGKECSFHCSPSCHFAQTGPDWKYGCLHKAWPTNQAGDFVPIVECDGDPAKCEIPAKLLKRYIVGRQARIRNAQAKQRVASKEIEVALRVPKPKEKTDAREGPPWGSLSPS